jgi:hypothetical protein
MARPKTPVPDTLIRDRLARGLRLTDPAGLSTILDRVVADRGVDMVLTDEAITLLGWACREQSPHAVDHLLKLGANPDLKDPEGRSPYFHLLDRRLHVRLVFGENPPDVGAIDAIGLRLWEAGAILGTVEAEKDTVLMAADICPPTLAPLLVGQYLERAPSESRPDLVDGLMRSFLKGMTRVVRPWFRAEAFSGALLDKVDPVAQAAHHWTVLHALYGHGARFAPLYGDLENTLSLMRPVEFPGVYPGAEKALRAIIDHWTGMEENALLDHVLPQGPVAGARQRKI